MSKQPSIPVAVQMYSLRHLDQPLDETLAHVSAIGYSGIETVGDHGLTADEMNALLEKHGLQIVSGHFSLDALQSNLAGAIAFNQAVGNDVIIVPAVPDQLRVESAENWKHVGQVLDDLGARCADEGIRLQYHNHWWEMARFDGKYAIDWLLENASPDHVGFEPDLAWIVRGEADPLAMLSRYSGRYPRVHVKDLARPGESDNDMNLADVGYGTLDWDALLPAALSGGAEWFVVEHDVPPVPLENVTRSYDFLKSKLGT